MDLTQSKLTKTEWNNIEIPVADSEKTILQLICDGYHNTTLKRNDTLSLLSFMKMSVSAENELHLFNKYFSETIRILSPNYGQPLTKKNSKSADTATIIRMSSFEKNIDLSKEYIFEFVLLEHISNILTVPSLRTFSIYTLYQLKKASVVNVNTHVQKYLEFILTEHTVLPKEIVYNACSVIEQNINVIKYADIQLFDHQKQLFDFIRTTEKDVPKLVLYIAPTGTGKTLSPLALSAENRILFVCVARHVGLALGKSAISCGKKIAFAFGCDTSSDIRLHNFSASIYTKNKRTGGVGKIDNAQGDKVEIMICDVKSYLVAMHYMLSFNSSQNIITYWDEPTITMDYEDHPLHETIHQNWSQNLITTIVLSCATLPKETEIASVIHDFRQKFENPIIKSITSFDCKKSISLIDRNGFCSLPHLLFENYDDMIRSVHYCMENKTVLRYFDLASVVEFIVWTKVDIELEDATMASIKELYLQLLEEVDEDNWSSVFKLFKTQKKQKFVSVGDISCAGILGSRVSTEDAHTLTDGPTIYLTENPLKIGQFCVQQLKFNAQILENIKSNIASNNVLQKKISIIEKFIEDESDQNAAVADASHEKKGSDKKNTDKKNNRNIEEIPVKGQIKKLTQDLHVLRDQIVTLQLPDKYVPNSLEHQKKYAVTVSKRAFMSSVDEHYIAKIMELDVDDMAKVLLLVGIGMFTTDANMAYTEIMKELAYKQKLYLIIASTDYIYGTNYQFCHAFIGKDLTKMSQQKTVQALGRVGRSNIQQEYTVRFRDDMLLKQLFLPLQKNIEAVNMARLFTSD